MKPKVTVKKDVFKTLGLSHIEVGFQKDSKHNSGESTIEVAKNNEEIFKFMSNPKIDNLNRRLKEITKLSIDYLVDGKGKSKIEYESSEIIKKPMRTAKYRNSPETIARKGFDCGTIETGEMYNKITATFFKGKK